MNGDGLEFAAVNHALRNLERGRLAAVENIGPEGQAAGVRRTVKQSVVRRGHKGLIGAQTALEHGAVFQFFDAWLAGAPRSITDWSDSRQAQITQPIWHDYLLAE